MCALALAVAFLMTGCWDSREVNKKNLVTMVILDKKDGQFEFTVEIALISSGKSGESGGGATKQEYVKGTGFSFVEARDNVDMQMDLPIYLGTVRALVLTERAAQNDLAEYLFRLRENVNYRQKVFLVITEDDPETLTQFKSETSQPAGFVIDDTLHTVTSLGHSCIPTSEKIVNNILANEPFLLQHISLVDKQIKLTGYSVFRSAKLVGFIPIQGTQGLTYMLDNKPEWRYRLAAGGMDYTVKVELNKRQIKPAYQNGKITFDVNLSFDATIEYQSAVSLFPIDAQVKKELAANLNATLGQQIRDAIDQSQFQFQCDYLTFANAFRVAYPDAYDKMDWQTEYPKAEVTVTTSVDIAVGDKMDIEVASIGG